LHIYNGDFLKAFILLALVAFGGWQYYQQNVSEPAPVETYANVQPDTYFNDQPPPVEAPVYSQPTQSFRCDGRQHCSQMTSREEAEFFVRNCPDTMMDGDHDLNPCENDSRF